MKTYRNISNPIISIIIPSYNKGTYIRDTLDSLQAQIHYNWEAIIIDDGSTDESIGVVQNYCKKDTRFRLIKRKRNPKGGSTCRNIGIENALGNYIIFLDADDILSPDCLKRRMSYFEQDPYSNFLVSSGGTFYHEVGDSHSLWVSGKSNHLVMFLSHSLPWQTTAPIWKTSFLKELKGFDEDYPRLQDVELHTRALLQRDVKYKIIGGAPDFYYRIDEDRKLKAPYKFVDTFIKAVEIYTSKIEKLLEARDDKSTLLKALNGTYQSAYLTTQVQFDLGNISLVERNELFDSIIKFHHPQGLFKAYIRGLKLGVHKAKGYNWIMKKLLTS